jgi:glycosyltransferase involved in cell wall biosynthesis
MEERIKVLQLIKSLGRGGAEMLLQQTLRFHDQQKFEFHYIYFLPWKNAMVEPIRKAGGTVENIPASNNAQILFSVFRISQYCKKHGIQLIHCHLPWAGFLGRLVHKLHGIPVLYTEHNKQERYHFITRTINKYSFNFQTACISVGDEVEGSIQKNIHPSVAVRTIRNGVDTKYFIRNENEGKALRQKLGISLDAPVIANVAVFRIQKRLIAWLQVIEQLKKKHPTLKAFLVGDGPLASQISQTITELHLEDTVILPGLVEEVRPWLSATDVFCMTSEFEGLPLALLEAMSMETAVVATAAGGVAEVIQPGVNGLLAEVENLHEIPALVERVLADPSLSKRLRQAARKRIEDSYGLQGMTAAIEEFYLETLQSQRAWSLR